MPDDNKPQMTDVEKLLMERMDRLEAENKQLAKSNAELTAMNRSLLGGKQPTEPPVDAKKEHDEMWERLKGGLRNA